MAKRNKRRRKIKLRTLLRLARSHFNNPNETPRTKAFSVALATFMAFMPLYGFQTITGLLLAFILRLNKILVVVLINIITPYPILPFIMYFSFRAGGVFFKTPLELDLTTTQSLDFYLTLIRENFLQYFIGGILLGCFFGALAGLITYPLFVWMSKKRKAASGSL